MSCGKSVNTPSLFRVKVKIILRRAAKLTTEIESILHELAHYKRKDILYIFAWFQVAHCPVMWYVCILAGYGGRH